MPIKALEDRRMKPPVVGRLWKGGVKSENRPGKDLGSYFRFTSNIPNAVKDFHLLYTNKPNNIPFFFPFDDYEGNFYTCCEAYGSSRLLHRCDGEYVEMYYDKAQKVYKHPNYGTMKCDGSCNWVARLSMVLPAFLEKHAGIVTIELHGFNDILELDAQLKFHQNTRGTLKGVPFVLYRSPQMISTPDHGRQEKWLVGIRPDTKLMTMLIQEPARQGLASGVNAQLDSGIIVDEDGVVIDDSEPIEAEIVPDEPVKQTNKPEPVRKPEPAKQTTTDYKALARAGNWVGAIAGIPRYAGDFPKFMGAAQKIVIKGINNPALTGRGEDAPELKSRLFSVMEYYAKCKDEGYDEFGVLEAIHKGLEGHGLGELLKPIATDDFDAIPSASDATQAALIPNDDTPASQNAAMM